MAKDLNSWTGVVRATRDAEINTSGSGMTICKFSGASNGYKDEVSFFNFVIFGKFADSIGKYITKGKRMAIAAELKQNKWVDKSTQQNRYSIDLIVKDLQLLDGGNDSRQTEAMFQQKDSGNFKEDMEF